MKRILFVFIPISFLIALAAGFIAYRAVAFGVTAIPFLAADVAPIHLSYSLDKEWYESFFAGVEISPEVSPVTAAVAPHHLVAGRYVARLFSKLQLQRPEVVVLVGPNHFERGRFSVATDTGSWKTPYGAVGTANTIVEELVRSSGIVGVDSAAVGQEHGLSVLVPFIKRTWPDADIIPLIFKANTSSSTVEKIVLDLTRILPDQSLVLASVDFSHYLPQTIADWHDELSRTVLATGDADRVDELEVDSRPSLLALLKYTKIKQAQTFSELSHTNSARLIEQPDLPETTSHVTGYFTAGLPAESPAITVQFFGDMMLDRNVAKAMGSEGLDYIFKDLRGMENRFFSGMDFLVANLEGPFAPVRVPTTKSIAFRFAPPLAKQLRQYGFDAVSLANNHSVDMGWKNVDFTQKVLAENGIGYFGDGLREGVVFTWLSEPRGTNGERVAFVGLNNTDHALKMDKVRQTMDAARAAAKYIIVMPHWGPEYKRISRSEERVLARQLIDWGATAVVGAHPHVVQEMEVYNDRPIFYSLGNFIFDQYFSKETQEGLGVGLVLQAGKVEKAYAFPIYGTRSQVRLMSGSRRREFFTWFERNSRSPNAQWQNGILDL